jgi:hypothetical protein
MKLPPVAGPLRVAASPLKGATPVARQSRFHGVSRLDHFMRSSVQCEVEQLA